MESTMPCYERKYDRRRSVSMEWVLELALELAEAAFIREFGISICIKPVGLQVGTFRTRGIPASKS